MKKFIVVNRKTLETVFEGTNEDYIKLCNYEYFCSEYNDIEDDYYYNEFLFGDSSNFDLAEVE